MSHFFEHFHVFLALISYYFVKDIWIYINENIVFFFLMILWFDFDIVVMLAL